MRLASSVPSVALSRPDPEPDHGDRMPTPPLLPVREPLAQPEDSISSLTIEDFVHLARMSGAL